MPPDGRETPIAPERVTISLGVALAPQHASDPATLLQAADIALYTAKRKGKNRVELFHGAALVTDPNPIQG